MSDADLKTPSATLEAEAPDTATEQTTQRRMTLNMGPQHPSTHGVLRVLLELDGETVTSAYPDIGFLHTGIEKQCEAEKWYQVVPLTDRVDYLANLNNNLTYALAVEKLLGITDAIPEEAKQTFANRRTALRRYAEPEEVAHATLSLVLPAASFITGATLLVDGGVTIRNA